MLAGIGYSNDPDSAAAGKWAAEQAVSQAGRKDACDLALLFCTARHNQRVLREAVSAALGRDVPVYGGGAVGVITNENFGYAGDQVGVACLWLDGVTCDVLTDGGLSDGEESAGFRIGERLVRTGLPSDSPVLLFYDAVRRNDESGVRLNMATWLLKGLEEALGYSPNLSGAGLQGDHACSRTGQYTGDGIGEQSVMALAFGGDIHMDSVIMHGCRPASGYYTVTKADGPVILEINHTPAVEFISEILGPAVKPEQWPFFLLFGINSGERWGAYDQEQYASRLCLSIDRERGGIVMFEPDMVEGTEFQLMYCSTDLDYMRPRFESAFQNLNGRRPVFAVYIDCAGRCAGYSGADVEDALVLQEVVGGRVPVLGIYTGVEIAPVAGRPRGLDWTGVFCLFSQGESDAPENTVPAKRENAPAKTRPAPDMPGEFSNMLIEQNAAKVLALEKQDLTIRYELELKRRGFGLLAELAVSLRPTDDDYIEMFEGVARRLNAALNMQRTVVLLHDGGGMFKPLVLQGFSEEEHERLREKSVHIPDEFLNACPAVVNSETRSGLFGRPREEYALPFFVAAPIYTHGKVSALLLTGRLVEAEPYFTRLGGSDMETVCAIAELLGAALVRLRLKDVTERAERDSLTGLLNRGAFRIAVEDYLSGGEKQTGAFMMIDVDHFKSVNDTYGHTAGDELLKACADSMRNALRSTDMIGRQGGDEFVVFCPGIESGETAKQRAERLAAAWESVVPGGSDNHITASIGIALVSPGGTPFQELYDNADAALYEAKESGRNCYVLHTRAEPPE